MRNKFFIPFVMLAWFFVQCTSDKAPIDKETMENILYDYYVASAVAQVNQAANRDSMSYIIQAYFNAALHKYGVTKELFDEAMLYYQRNSLENKEIYDNLHERLLAETGGEDASLSEDKYAMLTEKGDSAKIWNGVSSMLLYAKPPLNRNDFSIKCDSALHPGDKLELYFNSMLIAQEGSRDLTVLIALDYENDSIGQTVRHVNSNGKTEISVITDKSHKVRRIFGFFTLLENSNDAKSTLRMAYVNGIGMVRLRQQTITETKNTNEKDTPVGMPQAALPPLAIRKDSTLRRN